MLHCSYIKASESWSEKNSPTRVTHRMTLQIACAVFGRGEEEEGGGGEYAEIEQRSH